MGLLQNIKTALFPSESDPDGPPAWVGRLKDAKYEPNIGQGFSFVFLDLSTFIPVKSAAFQSIDSNGVFMQHNGTGGMRFPMLMVLSGANNDIEARIALQALITKGYGTLYHPVFGPVTTCITGEIEQINAFVTAANQTSFVVEFIEATIPRESEEQNFSAALDSYLDSAAQSFADTVKTLDKADEIGLANKIKDSIGKVKQMTTRVSAGIAATQSAVDDTFDSINNAIDTLVKDPLMLARQVQNLCLTPARELALIKDKLEAYKNLAADIFGLNPEPKPNSYDFEPLNNYAVDSLIVGTMTAGLSQLGYNNDFEYKKDLILALDSASTTLDDYQEWADNGADVLGITNNSGDWIELANTVSISNAQILKQISKSRDTLTEVKITTTYRRNTAAWCYELNGSIKPDVLTKFARENDLGGDEHFYIDAGRELVYYV